MTNMNEMVHEENLNFAVFTDEERALMARGVLHLDEMVSAYSLESGENGLEKRAYAALGQYLSNRKEAFECLKACAEADDEVNLEENRQEAMFQDLYLDQLMEHLSSVSNHYTQSERCDRLYRFAQGMASVLEGQYPVSSEAYTGEVSAEVEKALAKEVCSLAAMLNVSMCDMHEITEDAVVKGTVKAGAVLAQANRSKLYDEALCAYVLAHQGKLTTLRQDISMEECVAFIAMTQDVDELRRLEKVGLISEQVGAILAFILLMAALMACLTALPHVFVLAMEALGLTGIAEIVAAMFLSTLVMVGSLVLMYKEAEDQVLGDAIETIYDQAGRMSSYLTIIMPMKVRKWLQNRRQNPAPSVASLVPQKAQPVQYEEVSGQVFA